MDKDADLVPPAHLEVGEAFREAFEALSLNPASLDEARDIHDRVELRMREAFARGELRPQVYDHRLDKCFDLPDRELWRTTNDMLFGLESIFCPHTNPGPNTGKRRWLLEREKFASWLNRELGISPSLGERGADAFTPSQHQRSTPSISAEAVTRLSRLERKARKRGAVSLRPADKVHVAEMRELMQSQQAPSLSAAAGMVVSRGNVAGHGTDESKVRRLRDRYSAEYGD